MEAGDRKSRSMWGYHTTRRPTSAGDSAERQDDLGFFDEWLDRLGEYVADPYSVPVEWRREFDRLRAEPAPTISVTRKSAAPSKAAIKRLVDSIRAAGMK